jgi:hypothetical protein
VAQLLISHSVSKFVALLANCVPVNFLANKESN